MIPHKSQRAVISRMILVMHKPQQSRQGTRLIEDNRHVGHRPWLEDKIVRPAEAKFNELLERRTKQLRVENV